MIEAPPSAPQLDANGNVRDVALADLAGDPMTMTQLRQRALALALTLAATGLSCADDDDPDPRPTQEEMQQVASDACEKGIECGTVPGDVTQEECVANQLGAYQADPECLAVYHLDECLATQTCDELDRLDQLHMGDCADERDEASGLTALCVAP